MMVLPGTPCYMCVPWEYGGREERDATKDLMGRLHPNFDKTHYVHGLIIGCVLQGGGLVNPVSQYCSTRCT